MKKTKFMVTSVVLDVLQRSGKYHCALCCKGIVNNSIEYSRCKLWVQKKCRGITGRLVTTRKYICPRCTGEPRPIDERTMIQVNVEVSKPDAKDTFCYLGDMLCSDGGCDFAIAGKCCVAGWSSGNYSLSSPPAISLHRCVPKYTRPMSARLCSMVAKPGVRTSWA